MHVVDHDQRFSCRSLPVSLFVSLHACECDGGLRVRKQVRPLVKFAAVMSCTTEKNLCACRS